MKNLVEIITPASFIALFFVAYWFVQYPSEFGQGLLFKNIETRKDTAMCVTAWAFFGLAVFAVVVATDHLFP